MNQERYEISPNEINKQLELCREIARRENRPRLALVDTFGCQQNEADSELIRGYLAEMGCQMTRDEKQADLIVLNTCAVREHAEQRVFGNIGGYSHTKKEKPGQIIAVCGCMAARREVADKIKNSYRAVDLVFGPDELWSFPEKLNRVLTEKKRVFATGSGNGCVAEGIPRLRDGGVKAWLSVMYGCNNFCSYCIVPYTRLRERSRRPELVIAEAKELIAAGYKDITLLGQNVNSYGKDLPGCMSFAQLIREICALEGDFVLRFMTSHPKDATEELFLSMAECNKCEKHLHLPLQSGSDEILRRMNRRYDSARYLDQVKRARELMPDIVLTTDIIVGFPGETEEDFDATMKVVEQVGFDAMFTFIYSKRPGTPAAEMEDPFTRKEKQLRFDRLLALQNKISEEKHRAYVGSVRRVLIDGEDKGGELLTGRTQGGRLVRLKGSRDLIGSFADVKITDSNTWALFGELADK